MPKIVRLSIKSQEMDFKNKGSIWRQPRPRLYSTDQVHFFGGGFEILYAK